MPDTLFPVNPEPDPPASRDAVPLLALLAQIGAARGLLPLLAEFGGFTLTADDRRFLDGPAVVHSAGGWHEDIPAWLFDQLRAERVEIVLGGAPWIVGPTELTAVMYSAVCEAPLDGDHADLYLWASTNAVARHRGCPSGDLWAALGYPPIPDSAVITRGGRLWPVYQPLAEAVRRRVIHHARSGATRSGETRAGAMGRERAEEPAPAIAPAPAMAPEGGGNPPARILTSLFDLL